MTQRAAPTPKKSRRKRSGEDEARAADLRKQIKRLFRKVRRHVGDDDRDPSDERPTFDAHEFHQHQQRVADIESDHVEAWAGLAPSRPELPFPDSVTPC